MESFDVAGQRIRIDRFLPSNSRPHPAVLILHGADGLPGRGLPYREMAARFAANGYLAFLLHYFDATNDGLRPNPLNPLNFAAWITAIGEGIGYALRQPETLSGPVGLVGFSLGGYLAVAAGARDPRVGAVVECCGGVADLFLRGMETMPPVLILHGGADAVVPVSEAHKLQRLLAEKGRSHELWIYPGRGHQFVGPDFEDAFLRSLNFLGRHLKDDRATPEAG
ncbi:MAG TPA: dienelactone hydrolase family protein [Gemmataceae bacterium]|nr:dienelactone hydrolase family protein [Gemmataceae bacterium]